MALNLDNIETNRLLLRGMEEEDGELVVKWRSDENVYRYFKSPHKITLNEHLNWYRNNYLHNKYRFEWICIEKSTSDRIGAFGLIRGKEEVEVSYLLAPGSRGKGYASEVIRALMDYASKKFGSRQVIAEIHEENKASVELVKNLGFEVIATNKPFITYGVGV